jgi:hypothetical protein
MKVKNVTPVGIFIGEYQGENGFAIEFHLTRDGRVLVSQSGLVSNNFSYHSEQSQAFCSGRKMTPAEAIAEIRSNGGTADYERWV